MLSDYLCICLRYGRDVINLLQLLLQGVVILDDPIVHYCSPLKSIKVRMCVDICLVAMSCPSSVSDGDIVVVAGCTLDGHPLDAVTAEPLCASELGGLEHRLIGLVVCNGDNSAGVVATGLKDFESLDANFATLVLVTEVANDTTTFVLLFGLSHLAVEECSSGEPWDHSRKHLARSY